MKKKILSLLLMTTLLAISVVGCGKSDEKETASSEGIRVGTNTALGTATPYVARELGYLNDTGIEIVDFSDGAALMEAFSAGELDIAFVGVTPAATWALKGTELKVVASCNGGGHVIMTREETGITSVEDLAGKKLAGPSVGTVTDSLLRDKVLPDAGLTVDDLTIVTGMKPADMATVLEVSKEVDAIMTWEPFASQAESTYDDIVVVYDSPKVIKEETGSDAFYPVNVVVASQDFIDNRGDELENFLEIYKKTVDFVNTDESANSILAKVLELEESVVEAARERIDYTFDIDMEATMTTLQWACDLGYIDELPEEKELFLSK